MLAIVSWGLIFDPVLPQKQLVYRINWSYVFKACFLPKMAAKLDHLIPLELLQDPNILRKKANNE